MPDWKMGQKIDDELYAFGFFVNGDHAMLRCRRCSCVVDLFFAQEHAIWHERLRRAVDETDMLE